MRRMGSDATRITGVGGAVREFKKQCVRVKAKSLEPSISAILVAYAKNGKNGISSDTKIYHLHGIQP